MRKLPRLVDMIGPDEPKLAPVSKRRLGSAADAKVDDGPQADRSRLHKSTGLDGKPRFWVEGEPIPLILGPIVRTGSLAADSLITFDGALPVEFN